MKLKSGIFAFGTTASVLLAAFFLGGLFPFGYETISWCDMNQQAIPLFCNLKDILQGDSSLFLNLKNAGGMNFYSVFFFFLSSPFSFIVAFVPKIYIPYLMNILVILKLCTAAFTAGIFFEKCFKSLSSGVKTALSASYALCGYGMMFYQNIMWLDIMYLFPIIMLGIYKLLKEEKPWLLMASLTISVVLNFYISFMIFLFVIIFFGIFAFFFKNAHRRIYTDLAFCGLFSLGLSSVVLIPCFLQYTASGRQSGILTELKEASFFAPKETTLQILLSSGIVLAAVFLLLPKLSVKSKETKFLLVLFTLTATPLVIEPINLMWHTGSYMSFPARYGFITVFLGLCLFAKEISEVKFCEKSSKTALLSVIISVIAIALFMLRFTKVNINYLSNYVGTLWGDEYSYKYLLILCGAGILGYVLIMLSGKKGYLSGRIISLLLCVLVAVEGLSAVKIYMVSAKNKFDLYNYQSFLQLEEKADKEGFYRVNTEKKLIDANMTGGAGFNSISHYTSLNSETAMTAAKQMGYSSYWMETGNWGGSILSDALLSVGYTVSKAESNFVLSSNDYYLGLGIKAENSPDEKLSDKDRLLSVGKAFGKILGTDNPAVKYEPENLVDCSFYEYKNSYYIGNDMNTGRISYKLNIKDRQTLYFDCYNGFSNNLVEEINGSFDIYVNGELLEGEYPRQNKNGLLKLGSFRKETVNITIVVLKDTNCSSFGVYGVDENSVRNAVEKAQCLNLTEKGGKIVGKVSSKGKYFLSVPYSEDFNITLNGKKVEFSKVLTGYTVLNLEEKGRLEIGLVPKGFGVSLVISGLFAVLLILYYIFKPKTSDIFKNIVCGVFLGVFGTTLLLVYIMPTAIKLYELIK